MKEHCPKRNAKKAAGKPSQGAKPVAKKKKGPKPISSAKPAA